MFGSCDRARTRSLVQELFMCGTDKTRRQSWGTTVNNHFISAAQLPFHSFLVSERSLTQSSSQKHTLCRQAVLPFKIKAL